MQGLAELAAASAQRRPRCASSCAIRGSLRSRSRSRRTVRPAAAPERRRRSVQVVTSLVVRRRPHERRRASGPEGHAGHELLFRRIDDLMTRLHAHEDRSSCVNASVWRVRICSAECGPPSDRRLPAQRQLEERAPAHAVADRRGTAKSTPRRHRGAVAAAGGGQCTTSLLKSIVPTHFVALKPAVM